LGQYYYLVATLPYLSFDSEAPISEEQFLDACRFWMPEEELEELRRTRINMNAEDLGGNSLQREWFVRENGLRNTLAEFRAGRQGWDPVRHVREISFGGIPEPLPELTAVQANARSAVEEQGPKQAEELLDRFRWRILDDLEVGHYFDLKKLMVYYLKAQILWRRDLFDRERGMEILRRTYEAITEPLEQYRHEQEET
jgi:hypothetical protein